MNYYELPEYDDELKKMIKSNPAFSKLKGKSIVITGARGLIGSVIADAMLYANLAFNLGCKVYAVVRNMEKAKNRFARYKNEDFFRLIQADVNEDQIRIDNDIDYFIHGASNTHPVYYASRPIETIRTNVMGTDRTLEFAVKHNCKRYIFLSSVEIYGENRGDTEKFSEEYCGYIDCNTLRAGYPESKRTGESLCQAYRKEMGLDCVIARIARCYGAGLLPEDSKALTQFLKKAAQGEDIVLKSDGNQYYSYVYALDAADAITFLLTEGKDGDAYNIVGRDSDIRLKDLADLIAKEAGRKVVFELPDKKEFEGYSKATKALLSGEKLTKLGWIGKWSIQEGIREIMT